MKEFKMSAGTYYITDACMTDPHDGNWSGYYVDFLLKHDWDWNEGSKIGSSFVRSTGYDGGGYVYDMKGNKVGEWGSDAANVSVVPAKLCREVPEHYGMKVTFEEDFVIKSYPDTIVVGDRYRVRAWRHLHR